MKSPRKYTAEQKHAAIRRVLEIGPAAASRELGIPSGTLSSWAHKARRGVAGYALSRAEQAERESARERGLAATPAPAPAQEGPVEAKPVPSRGKVARVYTPSEKARALELAATVGVTAAGRQLGISRFSIYDWRRKVRRAAAG